MFGGCPRRGKKIGGPAGETTHAGVGDWTDCSLKCLTEVTCRYWHLDTSSSTCSTMTGDGVFADDTNFIAGLRGCNKFSNVTGWETCSATEPWLGLDAWNYVEPFFSEDWYFSKLQCIEECRTWYGYDFVSINWDLKQCVCMGEVDTNLPTVHPYACQDKNYTVISSSAWDESPTCDHLYFNKQVIYWQDYTIDGIDAACKYSEPQSLSGNSWDQKSEKLARTSIMFTDKVSIETPDQGVKVAFGAGTPQKLWDAASDHLLTWPWTLESGFRTTGSSLVFDFGDPKRSVIIWGLQFLKEQIVRVGGISNAEISYNYFKDVERAAYAADEWKSPVDITSDKYIFSIAVSDVDDNGLYFLKDAQSKPLVFTASSVSLLLNAGYINIDFIGAFYDFQTASAGKHSDNKADNFLTHKFENFWIKGL